MSSQNRRFLTPSPPLSSFLLSKVYLLNRLWGYPPPPLPRRHSLWKAPKLHILTDFGTNEYISFFCTFVFKPLYTFIAILFLQCNVNECELHILTDFGTNEYISFYCTFVFKPLHVHRNSVSTEMFVFRVF